MRTPPPDLDPDALVDALRHGWSIAALHVEHQPVGFGSYHWIVQDDGARWWVTVDDLVARRASPDQPLDAAFAALAGAMRTVRDLAAAGAPYAVAPITSRDGEPVRRIDDRHAVVVHPVVAGATHEWGEVLAAGSRSAVVDVLAALHRSPVGPDAPVHDIHRFDHRDLLERVAGGELEPTAAGPVGDAAHRLVTGRGGALLAALARFDQHAATGVTGREVLTHGEPHPGNLLEVDGAWVLVDWDTVALAPPERDLWMLVGSPAHPDLGDGGREVFSRYETTTGTTLDRNLLEAYRLRWDLADAAVYVQQLRAPHTGTADDDEAWANLQVVVDRLVAEGS